MAEQIACGAAYATLAPCILIEVEKRKKQPHNVDCAYGKMKFVLWLALFHVLVVEKLAFLTIIEGLEPLVSSLS